MPESLSIKNKYIIGIDEVGMGSYAGELVVCAFRAPLNWIIPGLNDSKKLSPSKREKLAELLVVDDSETQFTITSASPAVIDEKGLGWAHKSSIVAAILALYKEGDEVILDGNLGKHLFIAQGLPDNIPLVSVVKADGKYPVVMAASIIAKVYRDGIMKELHHKYPYYGWDTNIGYLAPAHLEGIRKYGLTDHHRKSYKIKL